MDLATIVQWAKDICSIATCAALLIRPVRERLMGTEAIREGQRCLLRSELVRLYYRHQDEKQLREFEYKLMDQCFKAYKALKGNSFIDHICREMYKWEIV